MGRRTTQRRTGMKDQGEAKQETDVDGAVEEVIKCITDIERQVEERVAEIMSAAQDAVASIRNHMKTKMVGLPKKTREMKMKDFQEKFPEDFKSGALQDLKKKFEDRAEAVEKVLATTSTRSKRTAEPATVMRTVRAKTTGPDVHVGRNEFNGVPLQTPMPFAGAAVAMPITMLVQSKRGARTKAANDPSAAVVTTKDGKQWALGAEGLQGIPESHRAEVAELLSSQFRFLASALGQKM